MRKWMILGALLIGALFSACSRSDAGHEAARPRVIVTTDGEIDDECSLVRFLLYCNEWDVEAIITSSSQYHWRGHKWAGDDWMDTVMGAYAQVYPNLVKHDARYPSPEFLLSRSFLGNVDAEGEMEQVTPGSQRIVEVLLDRSDPRPVWIQAWGGVNTLARALKTIEEDGTSHFHAYRLNSGSRYTHLFMTANGEVKHTRQNLIVKLVLPLGIGRLAIIEALTRQMAEIINYIRSLKEITLWK